MRQPDGERIHRAEQGREEEVEERDLTREGQASSQGSDPQV